MIHITQAMLPTIGIIPGFVTIARPLPSGAVMTPKMAIDYASSLIAAAAQAEGDRLILKKARAEKDAG